MVYDPSGKLVAWGDGQTPSFRLPGVNSPESLGEGSFYTVVVGGLNNNYTGDYELRVEAPPPLGHRQTSQTPLHDGGVLGGDPVQHSPGLVGIGHVPPGLAGSFAQDVVFGMSGNAAGLFAGMRTAAPASRPSSALAVQSVHSLGSISAPGAPVRISSAAARSLSQPAAPAHAAAIDALFSDPTARAWLGVI